MRLRLRKLGTGTVELTWASIDSITVGTHWINGEAILCPRPWWRGEESGLQSSACPECQAVAVRRRVYRAAFVGEARFPSLVEFSHDQKERFTLSRQWRYGTTVTIDRRTKQSQWEIRGGSFDVARSLESVVPFRDLDESFRRLFSLPAPVDPLRPWDTWSTAIELRMERAFKHAPPLPMTLQ